MDTGNVVPLRRTPPAGSSEATGPSGPPSDGGSSHGASSREPLWREAVGRQLRHERAVRGERIVDVAGRAGVSPQYLSEIERGRKDTSSEMLAALAGALDLTVRQLAQRSMGRLAATPPTGPVCLAA